MESKQIAFYEALFKQAKSFLCSRLDLNSYTVDYTYTELSEFFLTKEKTIKMHFGFLSHFDNFINHDKLDGIIFISQLEDNIKRFSKNKFKSRITISENKSLSIQLMPLEKFELERFKNYYQQNPPIALRYSVIDLILLAGMAQNRLPLSESNYQFWGSEKSFFHQYSDKLISFIQSREILGDIQKEIADYIEQISKYDNAKN